MKKKTKIGIIGLGYVGGAIYYWFKKQPSKYELFFYDKHKSIGSIEEVNQADIVFVAVPTPFYENGQGYDDSAVRESLKNIKNGKIIIIKSTVLPGSTSKFQKLYPKKIILFNPEFLRAKTAKKDFINPPMQLVGYTTKKSKLLAPKILGILPRASYSRIIKATEAEMVKYFINTFLATRVIFANQVYDLCQKLGEVNYNTVKDCAIQDKRIGYSHFDVFADGYRGYDGACLPKDVKALIQLAQKLKVDFGLLQKVEEINKKLRKKS